jgi:hypothetical protein
MHEAFREMYDKNIATSYEELLWFVRRLKDTRDGKD